MSKEYNQKIDDLHDDTSNSVIDLYLKRESTSSEEEKLVYNAMIDFYMKFKQAMDTTSAAISKVSEDMKRMSEQEKI